MTTFIESTQLDVWNATILKYRMWLRPWMDDGLLTRPPSKPKWKPRARERELYSLLFYIFVHSEEESSFRNKKNNAN